MNRIERIALAIALAAACAAAQAAPVINRCGALYGDDADKCKDSPIQKLNPDASPRELVPAPLTPEQRKAKDAKDRELMQCNLGNRDQKRKDDALLDRYQSGGEDDLQDARYQELGRQLRRVDEANGRMKRILERDRKLAQQAAFHPHRIPEPLRQDQEANRQRLRSELGTVEDAADAIQRINDRYDADLKRYRELVNGTAVMPCSGQQ